MQHAVRLVRAAEHAAMPWKNGGGTTHEIIAFPSRDDFLWRLSIADVAADGPFSSFPGVARTIMLLEGNGMRLRTDGAQAVVVREALRPLDFDGDAATDCTLLDGPVRDFNIMSVRGRIVHRWEVIRTFPFTPLVPPSATTSAVFSAGGRARVVAGDWAIDLARHDTLLVSAPARIDSIAADSAVLLVSFHA